MQDRGFNSFASNMIKLSVNETKWSSLLVRTRALILYISIWIFDFGPEKLPGLRETVLRLARLRQHQQHNSSLTGAKLQGPSYPVSKEFRHMSVQIELTVFHDKSNLLLTFYMNAIVSVFRQQNVSLIRQPDWIVIAFKSFPAVWWDRTCWHNSASSLLRINNFQT